MRPLLLRESSGLGVENNRGKRWLGLFEQYYSVIIQINNYFQTAIAHSLAPHTPTRLLPEGGSFYLKLPLNNKRRTAYKGILSLCFLCMGLHILVCNYWLFIVCIYLQLIGVLRPVQIFGHILYFVYLFSFTYILFTNNIMLVETVREICVSKFVPCRGYFHLENLKNELLSPQRWWGV